MVKTTIHDIVLHCMGRNVKIPNVDPNEYTYINLLNDVAERAMHQLPGTVNMLLHMRCQIPGTDSYLDILDDQSVTEMFKMHECQLVINVRVSNMDIIPPKEGHIIVYNEAMNDEQNAQVDNRGKNKVVVIENSEDEDCFNGSSSGESWNDGLNSDRGDGLGDDQVLMSKSDSSDADFSDFENNEYGEIVPDSESDQEIDPMREVMRQNMWVYNPREDIEFKKGQLFTNVDAFRAVLKDYVIQKGFPIMRVKNEKSRCTAKCGVKGCPWRIHASPIPDSTTYMIKSYTPDHTCVMDRKTREATSDWIAKKLVAVFRNHPRMSTKGIEAEMLKYGVQPSRMQIYRAKAKALEEIEGTHLASYTKLPKYAELLRQCNPDSICKIHYDNPTLLVQPRFLRIFISFKAQKDGFLGGCRPFVGFDGCHLKGPFGGVLLTAVALDGNDSIFPLAFAIAECENKDTWSWFFHFFVEYFGLFDSNIPLTFMSDRQKGLNLAYEELLPNVRGRNCSRHICSNLKTQFPGLLLNNLFWKAAKSYDVIGFTEAMESIKGINVEAWRYLSKIPVSSWCRHAFPTDMKCDQVTNNFTESFNAWIGDLRGRPILTLADGLRSKFMKKLHKRFEKGCTWTSSVTPKIVELLKNIAQQSRKCSLTMASAEIFEVADMDRTYIVHLAEKSCECGCFQLTGVPCKHAALGIIYKREQLESFCDPCYSKELYLKTYGHMIHPIPHEKRWPPLPDVLPKGVLPPPLRRAPGRPRVNRRRARDEAGPSQVKRSSTLKCGNCQGFGHNKRTCQKAPVCANKGNATATQQVTQRRGKPGRGIASTGLAGSVLWEHSQGNVPVVLSSQGSNPSFRGQVGSFGVEVNVTGTTNANKRQRGRPSKKNGASAAGNAATRIAVATSQGNPVQTMQTTHPNGSHQAAGSTIATHESNNMSSSVSMWF